MTVTDSTRRAAWNFSKAPRIRASELPPLRQLSVFRQGSRALEMYFCFHVNVARLRCGSPYAGGVSGSDGKQRQSAGFSVVPDRRAGVRALDGLRFEAPRAARQARKPHHRPLSEQDFRCAREPMRGDGPYRMPLAREEQDPVLAERLKVLPDRARRVALAAGLEPLLARILHERETAGEPSFELVQREHELELRLNALSAQVAAVAFEARCTAEKLERAASDFERREQERQLTIAEVSLVVVAALGTAAGIWALADDHSHGPIVLGIVGGGAATGLGALALARERHRLHFVHTPNRLTPLEMGKDPDHLYPTFVFRMLTAPESASGPSPRETLVAGWQRDLDAALSGKDALAAAELLRGSGGKYEDIVLELRARRFQELELSVQGIARDLELLDRALVRLFTMPGSAPLKPQP